ncbi:Fic family protein [Gordonia sp. N1V]|uniref:Fic family protein n=1 Tax=Gordonia sp. N1V TaxID=3034163 RepID=UPI0023E0B852|nr:Fic family protein [Gordonia sp. N1V]MDF3285015.1 Fic family protein [Gordonia sp. N1V]
MTAGGAHRPHVLPHLIDLTDEQFEAYERRMVALRTRELERYPALADGDFGLAHLQHIHAHLTADIYDFAGRIREPGQDTHALGIEHCPPELLPQVLPELFADIAGTRPDPTDRGRALYTTAEHWAALSWAHPMLDGNSRTQRVFFTRYLNDAGWDIDWRAVDADAVHAARHASFLTEDPSWLAAQLRPGLVEAGEHAEHTLAATTGQRHEQRPVEIFTAMLEHHAAGGDGETYTHPDQPHPPTPHDPTPPATPTIDADRAPSSRPRPPEPPPPPAPQPRPHL